MSPTDAEARNLEAIQKALDRHAAACENPVLEIQMNPHEVERLGWDEYRGIPIVGNSDLGTGMARIVCGSEDQGFESAEVFEEVHSHG